MFLRARAMHMLCFLCVLFVGAQSALAVEYHLGGVDANSEYIGQRAGDISPPADAGIFRFKDFLNGINYEDELGVVTSGDVPGFDVLLKDGKVDFEAILDSALQRNGAAWVPGTSNIQQAKFLGTGGYEFMIYDPNDNTTVLLALDLNYIDVSSAAVAFPAGGDADGEIIFGQLDSINDDALTTYGISKGSALKVSGGTLNQLVGGIGAKAVLQLTMSTISPPILTSNDRKGYLNTNFISGFGAVPPDQATVWDLTILAVPEPSSVILAAAGLLAGLAAARRGIRR